MFDFGEYANLDPDREMDLWKNAEGSRCLWMDSRAGVEGEELVDRLVAALVARARGEGVRGIRPPAVLVENRPTWLLDGVEICAVAIVCVNCG
jgi:hypothetical protein